MLKFLQRLSLCLAAGVLVGCASPARVEQMQSDAPLAVRSAIATSALKENVAIKDVTGGKETNPLWVSNISSADFERALELSLKAAGLLSPGRQLGKYQLVAHLGRLDQPMFGASMTVTASVQYTLIERSTGRDVFSRSISLPYTAAFGDALIGSERLKLANEGAARVNVQRLIEELSQLRP